MANPEKKIYGYVEKVTLVQQALTLPAKLDTGAKSASLYAQHIEKIQIDGMPYLKFIVPSREGDVEFKCAYLGEVKIKSRMGERGRSLIKKKSVQRPIVSMKIRVADKERTIRVNLANRKNFIYPLLLGREAIIALDGIIDPSKKFTIEALKSEQK